MVATNYVIGTSTAGVGETVASGAIAGTVNGLTQSTITTGSLNQAMSNPNQLLSNAGFGAFSAGISYAISAPIEAAADANIAGAEALGLDPSQIVSYANSVNIFENAIGGAVDLGLDLSQQPEPAPPQMNQQPDQQMNPGSCGGSGPYPCGGPSAVSDGL